MFSSGLTHSLQQLALHEWFDHIVGGGEVPGLVDEVHSFETGGERILADKKKGRWFEPSVKTSTEQKVE